MIRVVSSAANTSRTQVLAQDLTASGKPAEVGAPQKGDIVVAILSPAEHDAIPSGVVEALDLGLHIVVARTEPFDLPKLINHLAAVDLASADARQQLLEEIELLSSSDAPLALKVLTPNTRRSNRSTGIYVVAIVLFMFVVGLIGVGVFHWQAPQEEYAAIDTMAAQTRDFFVGPELLYFSTWLPRSTEDAAHYSATLSQLPTAYRPLMGLTVTAYAQGTPLPTIAPTQNEQ